MENPEITLKEISKAISYEDDITLFINYLLFVFNEARFGRYPLTRKEAITEMGKLIVNRYRRINKKMPKKEWKVNVYEFLKKLSEFDILGEEKVGWPKERDDV